MDKLTKAKKNKEAEETKKQTQDKAKQSVRGGTRSKSRKNRMAPQHMFHT
jgi:hypothetical protein